MATSVSASLGDAGEVTLGDVAGAAGVSQSTASRVLNGSTRRVRPELRARVLAAAARLGYSPDLRAQATARRVSTTVAVVVSDLTDPYSAHVAAGLVRGVQQGGLSAFVTERLTAQDAASDQIRLLRGQRLRAIVVIRPQGCAGLDDAVDQELRQVIAHGGRVVVVEPTEAATGRSLQAHGRAVARRMISGSIAVPAAAGEEETRDDGLSRAG